MVPLPGAEPTMRLKPPATSIVVPPSTRKSTHSRQVHVDTETISSNVPL